MTDVPRLRSFPEVAEATGIPLRTLREGSWGAKPKFTHIKIGRERYMTDEQVKDFLAAQTVSAGRTDELAATRDRAVAARARSRRSRKQPVALPPAA